MHIKLWHYDPISEPSFTVTIYIQQFGCMNRQNCPTNWQPSSDAVMQEPRSQRVVLLTHVPDRI